MKKVLSLVMAFVLLVSLAACSPSKTTEEKKDTAQTGTETEQKGTEEQTQPTERKVLNLIEATNITSLVPWIASDEISFRIIGNLVSGLFTNDVDGLPVEDLAEKYEVSEDGLTYTFHLRDAKWYTVDGQEYAPVTAHDFLYTLKKLLDPKEASQYSFMVATSGIKNGAEAVELSEGIVAFEQTKKELAGLTVEKFKDNDNQTAQQQFDAEKAKLEEKIKVQEEAFNTKYGSIEKANEEVYKIIDSIGVTVIDDKTIKYELATPVPYFTSLMAFCSFYPTNQKFAEEKGDKFGSSVENFLYNGAYIFKEWKVSQRHYLEKNEGYWDAANVKLDAVDFRVIEGVDNDTVVNMYLDGQIATAGLGGENVEKYGNRPDVVVTEDVSVFYLEVNQGNGEPTATKKLFSNVKARKALNMAIDKDYITKTIFANGSPTANYLVPQGLVASADYDGKDFREIAGQLYNGEEGYNLYNVEEAKKLWAEAMKEEGMTKVEVELLVSTGDLNANIATHMKNEWEKNLEGFTLVIRPLPFSEKVARSNRGEYDLNFTGWGADYADALTFLDLFVTAGGHNNTGYSNPEYDAIIKSAKSGELTAPSKTKERFDELVRAEKFLLEEEQVVVPLLQRARTGLRDPRLTGYKIQPFGTDLIFKWIDISAE